MSPPTRTSESADDPVARLAALLRTDKYIPFHVDLPDKEFPYVTLSIYGAVQTNELFVRLTNGISTFVEVIDSPLFAPAMADRIFGMDALDADVAFARANEMWEKHRNELVRH